MEAEVRDLLLIFTEAIKNGRHSKPAYNFVHQFTGSTHDIDENIN
jgi:hypothetical protein